MFPECTDTDGGKVLINLNHVISLRRDVEEDDLMMRELPNDILKNARSLA